MTADLSQIVKAYDVRGVVPDQWDEHLSALFGAAFAQVTAVPAGSGAIVVGHDMRPSSPGLSHAFARGAAEQGLDVVEIGLCSTDQLYYASGALDLPGAMFTASHNPAQYNGIKLCRAGAAPVGQDTGLADIRALVESWLDDPASAPAPAATPGTLSRRDTLADYAAYLRSLVDVSGIRPLKIVVDAGNGMGGHTVPTVLGDLPLTVVPLYFELDGTFPNHEANPSTPRTSSTSRPASAPRAPTSASPSTATPTAASSWTSAASRSPLRRHRPGRRPRTGPQRRPRHRHPQPHHLVVGPRGGPRARRHPRAHPRRPLLHQGRDGRHRRHLRRRALRPLLLPRLLERRHRHARRPPRPRRPRRPARPFSTLVAEYDRYPASGEINSTVTDQQATTARVRAAYADHPAATTDTLDGLTVTTPDWWFNLRPSNTEPLLRLNVEARDRQTLERLTTEVLELVRQ